jgi:hypothetical protein
MRSLKYLPNRILLSIYFLAAWPAFSETSMEAEILEAFFTVLFLAQVKLQYNRYPVPMSKKIFCGFVLVLFSQSATIHSTNSSFRISESIHFH